MIKTKYEVEKSVVDEYTTRSLLVHNNKMMMVRFDFKTGGVGAPHAHDAHDQVGYILSGRFELVCDGIAKTASAGDSYVAGPGVVHGVKCLEAGAILDVFTPIREEFL